MSKVPSSYASVCAGLVGIALAYIFGVLTAKKFDVVGLMAIAALAVLCLYSFRLVIHRQLQMPRMVEHHFHGVEQAGSALSIPRTLYYSGMLSAGFLIYRPVLGFTLSDWLFYASLGLTVLTMLGGRTLRFSGMPATMLGGAVLFALGSASASIAAPSPLASSLEAAKFLYLVVVWIWLGTVLLRTTSHLVISVSCWLIGMAASAAAAIVQMWGYGNFWSEAAAYGRFTGGADHPNDLGAQSAIALVPAIAFVARPLETPMKRALFAVVAILLVTGILLSGSVTALITAVVCVTLWVTSQFRLSLKSLAGTVLSAAVLVGVFIALSDSAVSTPLDRISFTLDASNEYCTSCSRIENNRLALESISAQPFIGRGLDEEGSKVPGGYQVHLMLLKAWYESGLLGFLGLGLILVSITSMGIRNIHGAGSNYSVRLSLALFVAFVAFIVFGMSQPLLYQRYAWLPAAYIVIQAAQIRRAERLAIVAQYPTSKEDGATQPNSSEGFRTAGSG